MNVDSELKSCILTDDFKTFQKIMSTNDNSDSVISDLIISIFDNIEDNKVSFVKYKDFIAKLPEYEKGSQDFHKIKIIGGIAARLILNKEIKKAVTLINVLGSDKKNAIITKACLEVIKTKENSIFEISNFISLSTAIVDDREKLITMIFFNLSRNAEERDECLNRQIQDSTCLLLNRFFDNKDVKTDKRIDRIIEAISKKHNIDKIISNELKDFYVVHLKRKENIEAVLTLMMICIACGSDDKRLEKDLKKMFLDMTQKFVLFSYDVVVSTFFQKIETAIRDKEYPVNNLLKVKDFIRILDAIKSNLTSTAYNDILRNMHNAIMIRAEILIPSGKLAIENWLGEPPKISSKFYNDLMEEYRDQILPRLNKG